MSKEYSFSDDLKHLRERMGITRNKAAEMCDLSPHSINRLEDHDHQAVQSLARYAAVLGYELELVMSARMCTPANIKGDTN